MRKLTLGTVRYLEVHVQYKMMYLFCDIKVLWGAQWQDGAGAGSGEDMELFFSYISRWSPSIKYMLAYRMCILEVIKVVYSIKMQAEKTFSLKL